MGTGFSAILLTCRDRDSLELVSDDSKRILSEKLPNFQTSKLDQSTRVVKIDVYYTIRPFKRTPGIKLNGRKGTISKPEKGPFQNHVSS